MHSPDISVIIANINIMYYKYSDQTKWTRISQKKFWSDPQLKIDRTIGLLEIKYETASPKQVIQRKRFLELGQLFCLRAHLYTYWRTYRLNKIDQDETIVVAKIVKIIDTRIKYIQS